MWPGKEGGLLASGGRRVILLLSRSLALCKLGELAELLPDVFRGLDKALLLLLLLEGVADEFDAAPEPPAVADETAALRVLSNICNSLRVSGPSFDGSPRAAKGENSEDMAAALAAAADEAAVEEEEFAFKGGVAAPGEEGLVVGGMNSPGCSIANRLCC